MQNLKNPSPLMRPAPFWSWNDKLDKAELVRQIKEMAEKGWGSYFMHSRVGLVTGYLSPEWMDLVNACVREAQKTNTYAWLYDEDKWPSGFAGGEVPEKSSKYRSRALVLLNKGEATEDDTVLASCTFDGVDYDICKRVSPLGNIWFNGASYVDLMSPDAVREFINCTHERYKAACGDEFGGRIPGIFTDEPCYLMWSHYNVPVVPWSDFLPDFFREMKGYSIEGHLPQLFFNMEGYNKVRFDFYDAATALFKESFTRQYADWCQENNLIMTGHFMAEDSLCEQTKWSGDVMSHYQLMHWPGVDKLSRHIEQVVTIKQVASVVDQLQKERSFCEVFGCVGGQVSFFHRKWIADWQAALGISFVNHHLSLYSMRGERKRDYPANLFYQQPWWEDERGFSDYLGRLSAFASQGRRSVDILVLQPLASVWSEYSPLHKETEYAPEKVYDIPFAELSKRLLEEKLDFHYGNETLMAEHGSVEGKALKVGDYAYGCVIIPPALNLKSSTLKLLSDYAAAGGTLIAVGGVPSLVNGEAQRVDLPGVLFARTVEEAAEMAGRAFTGRIEITDELTGANARTIYVHERRVGDSARYLLVNTDEHREMRALVKMPGSASGPLAAFDLGSGELYSLPAAGGRFNVTLAPAGSLLVIAGSEAAEAKDALPAALLSGAAFDNLDNRVPDVLIDNLDCTPMEENVLLLNDLTLELGGKEVYSGPVCGAWHTHFYPAPDGTPFRATYRFHSSQAVPGCFAAIEVAENLDSITLNGVPVHALKARGEAGAFNPSKSWKDHCFTKVPLPALAEGMNTLVIEGKKVNNITGPGWHIRVADWKNHTPTEAEEVYICGPFSVRPLSDGSFGIAPYKKPFGKNLTVEGYPFYGGRTLYKSEFNLPKIPGRVLVQLNGVNLASVRVRVNGKDCRTLRWAPFIVDITHAVESGSNTVELEASTTLVNAFGPNRTAGIKDARGIGPVHFVRMEWIKRGYELFDFGMESLGIYID
mgnify:CR=1 FL=1